MTIKGTGRILGTHLLIAIYKFAAVVLQFKQMRYTKRIQNTAAY